MSAVVSHISQVQAIDPAIIASVVTTGDLSKLSPQQKVALYNYRCQQAGLDPAAKPFDLLKLNGKEILYANATATQQLVGRHNLSVSIVSRDKVDDLYIVGARVASPDGRFSENTGAVPLGQLKGEALANAIMKATTKAIRRTVLAHLGLGMLDETEVATIPGAMTVDAAAASLVSDPRGDLTDVASDAVDTHVKALAALIDADKEEADIAESMRAYVADHLQADQPLYISVADELQKRNLCTKAGLRAWLQLGLEKR